MPAATPGLEPGAIVGPSGSARSCAQHVRLA
jgi:hypothetical protein